MAELKPFSTQVECPIEGCDEVMQVTLVPRSVPGRMRDIRVGVDIHEVTEHAKKHNAELGGVIIEETGERPDGVEFETACTHRYGWDERTETDRCVYCHEAAPENLLGPR